MEYHKYIAKQITDPHIRFLLSGGGEELEALKHRLKDEKIENVVFKGAVNS